MKIYLVGGAVRDLLLGLEQQDRDYVVVGGTTAEMLKLGYEQVGSSFPVFLHPETGEEYALARTERKTGVGYHGFEVNADQSVSLEDDLARRDLTINSMAMYNGGEVVDPYGGQSDLAAKVLRHTSSAFVEDPLRVIRLARFYGRYTDFTVAPETMNLATQMVLAGMLDELPDERFWAELEKGFASGDAGRFFMLLAKLGVLDKVKFFKQIYSPMSDDVVVRRANLAASVQRHSTSPAEAVDLFLAWTGNISAASTWLLKARPSIVKQASIIDVFIAIDSRPNIRNRDYELLHDALTLARAWSGNTALLDTFVRGVKALRALDVCGSSNDLALIERAVTSGREVKASMFPTLSGAAIGKAIRAERIARWKAMNL